MAKPSNENFYQRLKELSNISSQKPLNENVTKTLIDFERADDGSAYGVVKENHIYFIKRTSKKENTLDSSDFGYIGGAENKFTYSYKSLSEAQKDRNLLLKSLNEAFSLEAPVVPQVQKKTLNEGTEEKIDNPFTYLRSRIDGGKQRLSENNVTKFKSSLQPKSETGNKKAGLLPEAADYAIKKALGLISEDNKGIAYKEKVKDEGDISTEDSEIVDGERVDNKSGKEKPTAPINDSNAKKEADKNTASGKSGKLENKAVEKQIAEQDLSTADSQIVDGDRLDNKSGKETPQAPINDTNAKKEAEKRNASSGAGKTNDDDTFEDVDDEGGFEEKITESKEGKPFTEKSKSSGDISTADSDLNDKDSIVNSTKKIDTPDADYNSYNQPEKGHKEEKGAKLEPKAKEKSDISEKKAKNGQVLTTADSKIDTKQSLVNKGDATRPKTGKSEITADSEIVDGDIINKNKTKKESSTAPINDKNAKKEADKNNVGGGKLSSSGALTTADSKIDTKQSLVNKKGGSLMEAADLSTADSEINSNDSLVNSKATKEKPIAPINDSNAKKEADKNNVSEQDLSTADSQINMSDSVNEDDGEEELDAAASALQDLEIDTAEKETQPAPSQPPMDAPAPEMGGDLGGAPEMGGDASVPEESGEEDFDVNNLDVGGEEGEGGEEDSELQKNLGKLQHSIDDGDVSDAMTKSIVNTVVTALKDELGNLDAPDRKDMADKILKASPTGEEGGQEGSESEESPIGGEQEGESGDDNPNSAIDDHISNLNKGEKPVEEDAPMSTPDELGNNGDEGCTECGTFESYMKSRGYTSDNLEECSSMEMANMVSGYANGYNEGSNDGDFEQIAIYITPEVMQELQGYGHDEFVQNLTPFIEKVTEKVDFGHHEPMVSPDMGSDEGEFGEEGDATVSDTEPTGIESEIEVSDDTVDDVSGMDTEMGMDDAPAEIDAVPTEEPVMDDPQDLRSILMKALEMLDKAQIGAAEPTGDIEGDVSIDDVEAEAGIEAQSTDMEPEAEEDDEEEIVGSGGASAVGFSEGNGQVLAAGRPKPDGAPIEMTESEKKIRTYVRRKLEEMTGKRKPVVNESKSDNLKKLDKMIEQQFKLLKK